MSLPLTGSRLIAQDADRYIREMAQAGRVTVQFGDDSGRAGVKTIALGNAISDIATGALRTVGNLLHDAGRAAAEFVGDSIGGARDLQAQMSGVTAVLGGTNKELEQLNDLVIDLGIDPTLKVSSLEAAEAIEVLAKNGLDMQTIMDGAARATVFLSNATGGNFARSADIMTDAAAIFNFKGNEMISVVDGITAVTNNSKFAIDDYALFLANAGKTADNAEISFDDFNTTAALLAPSFSSGMTAGTGFANFILRLIPNTEKAKGVMADLNLIAEDGSNAFFDAQGNMRSMADVAQILQDSISGLTAEQRQQALITIFGRDALDAALAIAEQGAVGFRDLGAAMAEVDAEQSAATRVDNLAGAMDILAGVIEAVKLRIGGDYLPALADLARVTTSFIEGNADRFIDFFAQGADFIETFAGHLERGKTPVEAFRATLATMVSPETLELFDQAVATGTDLVVTAVDLGKWAVTHGPEIIRTLEFIGKALLTFKVITTVNSGVTGFLATMGRASTVFTAAGGGLSGVTAALGGPLVVAAGLAAVAIVGVAMAWGKFNEARQEGQDQVREGIAELEATAEATGNYEDQARRLAEALELSTTGLGRLTGTFGDIRDSILDLIIKTGDFSGSNHLLEDSLQEVFGAGLKVQNGVIQLDNHIIGYIDTVREAAAAAQEEAAAHNRQVEAYAVGNEILRESVLARQAEIEAQREQAAAAAATHEFRLAEIAAAEDSAAAYGRQREAIQEIVELSEFEIERRKAVAEATQDAAHDQAASIHNIITATMDLSVAQKALAEEPWNQAMIAQAQEAEGAMAAEFEAIKQSHRLMVQEIFIQNAQLGGGFNESAANVAVALGLMTQAEADLRLENERLNTEISRVGDSLLQTFLQDGVVSREEAVLLEQAIQGIESGAFTADEALRALSSGGLASFVESGGKVKESTKTAADGFKEIPEKATDAINEVLNVFGRPDWRDAGYDIPDDVAIGIAVGSKLPANEAATVVGGVVDEFDAEDWGGVGYNISSGIAGGITAGSGAISDAATAAVAAAVAAAQDAAGIASPSAVAATSIGLPWSQGIAAGIVAGVPFVTTAVSDLIGALQETTETEMGDWPASLFDFGSELAGFGSDLVRRFQAETLRPLQDNADAIADRIRLAQQRIAEGLGATSFEAAGLDLGELIQLGRNAPDAQTAREARLLLDLYREQSAASREIREEQERIAAIQKQQADFQFLQQQFEFLAFLRENGLDAADILGGLTLGLDANLPDLLAAMSSAMQQVVEQAEEELGIASASRRFMEIGHQIKEGLVLELNDRDRRVQTAVAALLSPPQANISLPQTPQQYFSTTTNNQVDRSNSVQIVNNGVRDVSTAAQLDYVLASYN